MAVPAAQIQGPPPLANELLEEIFLHLPTPADLARASIACTTFHQIITDRSFRRRFRALHPPTFLGFVGVHGFHPAEPPYPSAPLASDLAGAADFSYSFVPLPYGGPQWVPRDVRDGRVLLECSLDDEGKDISTKLAVCDISANLAVCDPLFRRYVRLPRIPESLTLQQDRLFEFASLLAPIGDDEDETSFKVIGIAQYTTKLLVFVFSSITGEWMELSATDILTDSDSQKQRRGLPHIVMAGEGAFGLCTLVGYSMPQKVYYTTWKIYGESSKRCQLERVIPLAGQYDFKPAGVTEGLLFIEGFPNEEVPLNQMPLPENWVLDYFSLDVKTSELKKVCRTWLYPDEATHVRPYFGFPPSLSKPSL